MICCLQLNPLLLCSISSLRRVGVHLTYSYTEFLFVRKIPYYNEAVGALMTCWVHACFLFVRKIAFYVEFRFARRLSLLDP